MTVGFSKATTCKDGGWMISFEVPDSEAQAILQLSMLRGEVMTLALVPYDVTRAEFNPSQD